MKKTKKLLSVLLAVCMILTMMPATAWAANPTPSIITVGATGADHTTLQAALNAAADGDTIQLLNDITESVSYNATVDKIITIDGQGHTITGVNASAPTALSLYGAGTIILKDIHLLGGTDTTASVCLNVQGAVNVIGIGTVTVTGGRATNSSYGLNNSSSGIIFLTTVTGGIATNFSYGAYNQGTGTINVDTATGGPAASSFGAYNSSNGNINANTATGSKDAVAGSSGDGVFNYGSGTVNVNTSKGDRYAVTNRNEGTVNVNTASNGGSYNNSGSGPINIATTSGITVTNTSTGAINAGSSVAAITLHKGTDASCVLDTVTVAVSGTAVSSLPSVYKDGVFGLWYTDKARTALYSGAAVTNGMELYSSFYVAPLSMPAIVGIAVPVRGAVPTASIADTTEYTAVIVWNGNPSVFAAGTVYTATITLTPKTGYTLTGVTNDFFAVNGATASNSGNTGVITAVFPATTSASSGGGGSSVVSYTVTFHTNGGTQVTLTSVRSGIAISAPADPSKEGFTFAGWYKDAALTKAYNFSAPVDTNTEMYAKWASAPQAAQQFTMIFNIGQVDSYLTTDSAAKTLRTMDVAPILSGNRTFLPIRFVLEPMGGTITWDQAEKKVTITNESTTIELWIGSNMAKVNGVLKMIDPDNTDVKPLLVKPGRTMLPVRFISESLDCKVSWDKATQQVIVTR